jgi:hypothetical protein
LSIVGVVEKLLEAHAVEKKGQELVFRTEFGRFLFWCISCDISRAATLEGWRGMMLDFNASLDTLSENEVATIVFLLRYSLNRQSIAIPDSY